MSERESNDAGSGPTDTGDGTSTSGQSGNVADPGDDRGDLNRGETGDSSSGNSDGEEGGGPGSR